MKVAYVSSHDPDLVAGWSGLVYHIGRAVRRQPGIEMTTVGPLREWLKPAVRVRQAWHHYARGTRHLRDHDPLTLAAWGWDASRAVARIAPDAVLAPGTTSVARLKTTAPIVIYTDATFATAAGRYAEFSNLSAASQRHGHAAERWAARHAAMQCFSAPHAARSAVEDYGAHPERVRVIPFGANFEHPPSASEAEQALLRREANRERGAPVRFLFLGVDWERKGGPLAVEVVRTLRERSLPAELDVVGCHPKVPGGVPPWVRALGFISKATPEGERRIQQILAEAHFLLLPTRAESFGVVFCEANALAVPVLASRVDGVPVWEGENGYAPAPEEGAGAYAAVVGRVLAQEGAYAALARSSRRTYDTRLNWDVAGAELARALAEAVRLGPPR